MSTPEAVNLRKERRNNYFKGLGHTKNATETTKGYAGWLAARPVLKGQVDEITGLM